MTLTVQPVLLGNPDDQDGVLVFDGGRLVAVLCRLSATHGHRAGQWFLESSFGVAALDTDMFGTIEQACASIDRAIIVRETQAAAASARRPPRPLH